MISSEHYAYCDNPECHWSSYVWLEALSVDELRKLMREEGWGKRGGKELCPECIDEHDRARRRTSAGRRRK